MFSTSASAAEFRDYLRTCTQPTLRQLLEAKRQKNFAELLGYAAVIESSLASAAEASGFLDYFAQLKRLKVGHVYSVWVTPAAYHWCAMTRLFLDAFFRPPSSSPLLQRYLEFLGLDLEAALVAHLNDFGRFVAAAYLRADAEVHFDVPVRVGLPNALPATGVALHDGGQSGRSAAAINLRTLGREAIERIKALDGQSTSVRTTVDVAAPERLVVSALPRWQSEDGTIIIDSFEPCLRLPYVETWPRIRSARGLERLRETLSRAFERLMRYDAALAREVLTLTHSITPIDSRGSAAEMSSGTSSAIFGASFLSLTEEPLFMAEMLLHEFCHNKLRLFEDAWPLLLPESQNRAEFYSPWRDDPRTLEGIQHGLYVFSSIAYFWLNVYHDREATDEEHAIAERRVATLVGQLRRGFAEFSRHARLTDQGQVFLEEMAERLHDLEGQTLRWDVQNIQPFFSGTLRDDSLRRLPLVEALARHRTNWDRQFKGAAHGLSACD